MVWFNADKKQIWQSEKSEWFIFLVHALTEGNIAPTNMDAAY